MNTKIKAYLTNDFGSPSLSEIVMIPQPQIQPSQVLVKVHYASINPIDWKTRKGLGWAANLIKKRLPMALGMDFSGEIVEVGSQLKNYWEKGNLVCGIQSINYHGGSFSEYIIVEARSLSRVPEQVKLTEAAALPLAGLAAWQAILKTSVKTQEQVLIHGVAGGVGHLMAQLLKLLGVDVYGTCSEHNLEKVKTLGVQGLNHQQNITENYQKYFDLLFDNVGGTSVGRVLSMLKVRGRVLTLSTTSYEQTKALGLSLNISVENVIVTMDCLGLNALLELLAQRKIKIWVDSIYPFDDIANAIKQSEEGSVTGKIIVKML